MVKFSRIALFYARHRTETSFAVFLIITVCSILTPMPPSDNSSTGKRHGCNCPQTASPTNVYDAFLLILFATNVLPECHEWNYKQAKFLLASLAARSIVLYLVPILKMVALPLIATVILDYTY